ncbi:MAG TPA: rRNA adenine N-6-methyltransferase family protein [Anaerolineaceae bacterium]|nr:rRNA adenine N-6-methyltransferase family protein [Anaerolineaceae bacterium]
MSRDKAQQSLLPYVPWSTTAWEALWAPYDQATYRLVLDQIGPEDIVLEIGAGDLRLARQMASIARKVYALEYNRYLIDRTMKSAGDPLPARLEVICADARSFPIPRGITMGVLLMRHCTYFQGYASKLKAAGCNKLITNARWHFGVEVVPLQIRRISYRELSIGWYACWCGQVGFVPGPAERLTIRVLEEIHEVIDCPDCFREPLDVKQEPFGV